VAAPYTNGFCERFHRTVAAEFFKIAFRTKIFTSLAELQEDLDAWLESYNTTRPDQGYRTQGRTRSQAFNDALEPEKEVTSVGCSSGLIIIGASGDPRLSTPQS